MLSKIYYHARRGTLLQVVSNRFGTICGVAHDVRNKMKYGMSAPVYAERIWVNPADCRWALGGDAVHKLTGLHARRASGRVIEAAWPADQAIPVMEVDKIRFCIQHWVDGVAWKDTGAFKHMEALIAERGSVDECRNMNDVVRRYRRLDAIFERVKNRSRFKTRKELNTRCFREWGGILIHVGPSGEPFFGGGGCHRFAIALILGIVMPAQIGMVHRSAIPYLQALRDWRM